MRGLAWSVAVVCFSSVLAAQPVLHEYFEWDDAAPMPASAGLPASPTAPTERLEVQAPANIPDDPAIVAGAVPEDQDNVNSRPQQPTADDEYHLDGNTSTPSRVGYSDPFTPSIPPFKRLYAYDAVNADLELVVAKSALRPVRIGGVARPSQDQFLGNQSISLTAGKPLRLPSVGPGARVLNARLTPPAAFQLFQDSAENLFVKGDESGTFEWVVHLAIERGAFGSSFADVSWASLAPFLPELPNAVTTAAKPVLERLELSPAVRPAAAMRRMVEYFRRFEPKEEQRPERGLQLYREIALSQQGVCRHRAFAFVVTGLALGLPSRFVRNEAHAWVEVYDGRLWHRLDLGGAASEMALTSDLEVPHEAPPDPYTWPPKSESGETMVERSLQAAMSGSANGAGGSGATGNGGTNTANGAGQSGPSLVSPSASGAQNEPNLPQTSPTFVTEDGPNEDVAPVSELPETRLTVSFGGASLKRGDRFSVQGTARNVHGEACGLMRVDVTLFEARTRSTFSAGTLVTDEQGRYSGQLVLPQRVPVGDYRVRVSTPGHRTCAATE